MRELLSPANTRKGALLGFVVALVSFPQIIRYVDVSAGHLPFDRPLALVWMFVGAWVCHWLVGMVLFAWSSRGHLIGLFPGSAHVLKGCGVAVLAAAALIPAYLSIDPWLRECVLSGNFPHTVGIKYPESLAGIVATAMWDGGFVTVAFTAGAVCYFSRLTGRVGLSLIFILLVQVIMARSQLTGLAWSGPLAMIYGLGVIFRLCSCLLFLRYGLIPPILLAVIVSLRSLAAL